MPGVPDVLKRMGELMEQLVLRKKREKKFWDRSRALARKQETLMKGAGSKPVESPEEDPRSATLIEMRGRGNTISAGAMVLANASVEAQPGHHVGNWKKKTEADKLLFEEPPKGDAPMQVGSIYRVWGVVDGARLMKERALLKDMLVSVQFDLTPLTKRDLLGVIVSYSDVNDDGEVFDNEVAGPVTAVAGKDGRIIAEKVKAVLSALEVQSSNVAWAVTDGGGDNHGSDKETVHGTPRRPTIVAYTA